ncbi:hypothetical protein B0J13DRAFT_460365 [Dactylonectria estremocensis]|uniref:MARVEL domain-containing protein n=1 Tax=Dactylonectria estremocensis TaxID=1079267 RepID=A0A9P9D831_9HYPO|nr:hypothetical protein B0J13DRAFT_460365 [Dactylonectria estremocensis]
MPFWLTIIRGVALILSLGVLIAAAHHLSLLGDFLRYFGGSNPAGFLIFDSIFTFLVLGGMLASEFFAPQLYFRLAFICGLILAAIFWLSAWAWAASFASDLYRMYWYSDSNPWAASMAAGAVLGAFTWVVVLVTLVFFIRACMASPQGSSFPARSQNDAEMNRYKLEGSVQA